MLFGEEALRAGMDLSSRPPEPADVALSAVSLLSVADWVEGNRSWEGVESPYPPPGSEAVRVTLLRADGGDPFFSYTVVKMGGGIITASGYGG